MNSPCSEYVKTLSRLPLFNDLSDAELALIAEGVSRLSLGEVRVVKSALNGRQQLLSIERKGSALAEVAAFDGGRYPATAEASRATTLSVLPPNYARRCLSSTAMRLCCGLEPN